MLAAIAKDLDYFYILSDEVTEERDRIKADYEQEKVFNSKSIFLLTKIQQLAWEWTIKKNNWRITVSACSFSSFSLI